ncbi:sulfotransferase [Alteromonas alba]|uniref:sulfotransferase n=1 Tax=Alteromonas alba TaxID=2079529 RepID=UPI0014791F71|nr:sulfotransferase [Alteromonas alba]
MNKKLFLVTGVPRSGTTFFTHVLNENPEILCGMERFHGPQLSPSRLTIEGFKEYDLERASAQNHLSIVAKKASEKLKAIGDKCPRSQGEIVNIY